MIILTILVLNKSMQAISFVDCFGSSHCYANLNQYSIDRSYIISISVEIGYHLSLRSFGYDQS